MAIRLRWYPEAYDDIEMIANYISRDSEFTQSRLLKQL
jgi:plasmid stabilization system protein ParE